MLQFIGTIAFGFWLLSSTCMFNVQRSMFNGLSSSLASSEISLNIFFQQDKHTSFFGCTAVVTVTVATTVCTGLPGHIN